MGTEKGTRPGAGGRMARTGLAALLLSAAFLLALASTPVHAKYASLVMDAETGRVLHAVNADTRNYPASLTKMMTLYLVFEALDKGRLSLDLGLDVSARAARQPASRLGLGKGTTISVGDAILALVTKSANDVATVIAENYSGSERRFALVMTAKARSLGMSRTTFRNASGLPHRGQLTTARDMAILARRLLTDFPQYYHYFSTDTFHYDGVSHRNHNKLLASYEGTDGIKTGYIRASGFNLVASARRGGERLIGVVFGGDSPGARDRHMAKLLDKGFRKLGTAPQQAKRLPPPLPPSRQSARKSAGKSGSQWGIQVGAYKSYSPAYAIAVKARARAPAYLEGGRIRIVSNGKRRPLYRARILGLSKRQAYRACRVLEKRNMPCMELRLRIQLAQAGG